MSKPEFWWCVKWKGQLIPMTISRSRKEVIEKWGKKTWAVKVGEVVRIRIEEVKKGGRP